LERNSKLGKMLRQTTELAWERRAKSAEEWAKAAEVRLVAAHARAETFKGELGTTRRLSLTLVLLVIPLSAEMLLRGLGWVG
jgi:hypothetical protein